jgi:hypothetical protein
MAIDPVGSSGIPEAGARRVEPPAAGDTGARPAARTSGTDSVQVSTAAREMAQPDIPLGALSGEELRVITTRLASGSYNQDAVIKAIASQIDGDLR